MEKEYFTILHLPMATPTVMVAEGPLQGLKLSVSDQCGCWPLIVIGAKGPLKVPPAGPKTEY